MTRDNLASMMGGRPVQYLVDAKGEPVLGSAGEHLHVALDENGQAAVDDDGRYVLVSVEVDD